MKRKFFTSLISSRNTIKICIFQVKLYFFRAVKVHSKTEGKAEISHYPLCHHKLDFLHYQYPHQNGTLVTTDEPTLTHLYHPVSVVFIGVHAWWCTFCGFGQMYDM